MKWFVIAALVLAVGCKKKKEEPATPPATGSAVATGSAMGSGSAAPDMAAAGSAAGSAVDVPTEQDFEAKAATDITDKNVDAKLKSLESDLATH